MRNVTLGPILLTSTLVAIAACSDATGTASTEDIEGDGGVTSDGGTTVDGGGTSDDGGASCAANQYRSGAECKPCSGACVAGSYESRACSSTADRACAPCAAVAGCASVTCASATDQQCVACAADFYLSGAACGE